MSEATLRGGDGEPPAVDVAAAVTTLNADTITADPTGLEAAADRAPADVDADTVAAVLEGLAAVERERHPWRDPDRLAQLYYREGLNQAGVGDRLGCSQRCVGRWMERFDLDPGVGRGDVFDGRLDPTATGTDR